MNEITSGVFFGSNLLGKASSPSNSIWINQNIKNAERLLEFNATISNIIASLTAPLNNSLGINHFTYVKLFNEKMFKISSNLEWIKFIINNKYYELDFYQKHIKNLAYQPIYKVLWDYEDNPVMLNALRCYNLRHALTIYIKGNGCVDMCNFATTREDVNLTDLYFNNIHYLKRFILYFKNKIAELIDVKEKALEDFLLYKKGLIVDESVVLKESWQMFLQQTRIKVFYFGSLRIILTPREIDCLRYLSLGQSVNSDSQQLFYLSF